MRRLQDPAKCGRPVCESNDANEWQVNYWISWAPKINSANRCCYWWRRPRIATAANLVITQRVNSSCFIVRRAIAMVFVTAAQMAIWQFISRLREKSAVPLSNSRRTVWQLMKCLNKVRNCYNVWRTVRGEHARGRGKQTPKCPFKIFFYNRNLQYTDKIRILSALSYLDFHLDKF